MFSPAILADLRASLHGALLLPGDPSYDEARRIHNAMIDRRPAVIVRCTGAHDVIMAVRFARRHRLTVAVHSSGHNVAGSSLCDDGMVIDLSRLKAIQVDAAARTARVEPGVVWSELGHELQEFGLAATGGFVGTTGVAGLTLGGGLGWMARKHGLALDNLLAVDIVTADGALLTASETENPDLFWGIRGGGGNFGIVTSFLFRVHPAGQVLAGMVLHPAAQAAAALSFWRSYEAELTPDATHGAFLFHAPEAMPVPERLRSDFILGLGGVYCGPLAAGEEALRPLRDFGPPALDTYRVMPYSAAQVMADFLAPPGRRNYWKSGFLKDFSDDFIVTALSWFGRAPSPLSSVFIEHDGDGALSRVPDDATAYPHRRWAYNFGITAVWHDPAHDDDNIRWTRGFWEAVQPWLADDVYVNYLGEEGAERVHSAYGRNHARLAAVKDRYDPDNFFRMNQNIQPARTT